MSVSIIIPTANRPDSIAVTLDRVCGQSVEPAEFEILVVDNGSGEHTQATVQKAIRRHPRHCIRYFDEPVPGLLSGRHRGALEAQSELLTFIDDDVDVASGWLTAILEDFADPDVHLVGGRNLPRYEVSPPSWLDAFWSPTPYGGRMCTYLSLLDLGDSPRSIDANYVWGLNFSIRRDTLFKLGGFHPDCIPKSLQRFQGDGETGLTKKANETSVLTLYEPRALIWHRISAARLTIEYFKERAFYEGVAMSYSTIRNAGAVTRETEQMRFNLADGFVGDTSSIQNERWRMLVQFSSWILGRNARIRHIKEEVERSFINGFEFHHAEVAADPQLLRWILQSHYWNYDFRCFMSAGIAHER